MEEPVLFSANEIGSQGQSLLPDWAVCAGKLLQAADYTLKSSGGSISLERKPSPSHLKFAQ
jgi:hypothetical protein